MHLRPKQFCRSAQNGANKRAWSLEATAILAAVPLVLSTINLRADPLDPALPPTIPLPQVLVTQNRLIPVPDPSATPPLHNAPVGQIPREPYQPFFEIDWSVALAASRTSGTNGLRYATTLSPQFSATHIGLRSSFGFSAQARLGVNSDQLTRLEQISLAANGQYALDRITQLSASARIALTQADPNAPGTSDQIIQTPLVTNGTLQAGIARQFGRFGLSLDTNLTREQQSDTMLVGNIARSNAANNMTGLGATLRGELEITPILNGFIETSANHNWFDAPPPLSIIKRDGWDLALTTGLNANWRDVWQVGASVGYAERRYDDASLGDLASILYALDLAYTPNNLLTFSGGLTTALTPANSLAATPATTDYTISANSIYQVAPWAQLRASLGQTWSLLQAGGVQKWSFSAGGGADFDLNKNVALNLDYLYTKAQTLPASAEDAHAISLGLTWSK